MHLRGTDKILSPAEMEANPGLRNIAQSEEEWRALRRQSIQYLASLPASTVIHIVADDPAALAAYRADLKVAGREAVLELPSPAARPRGLPAYVDLFRLSSCARVLLVGMFSSFSLAAVLMGNSSLLLLPTERASMAEHAHLRTSSCWMGSRAVVLVSGARRRLKRRNRTRIISRLGATTRGSWRSTCSATTSACARCRGSCGSGGMGERSFADVDQHCGARLLLPAPIRAPVFDSEGSP